MWRLPGFRECRGVYGCTDDDGGLSRAQVMHDDRRILIPLMACKPAWQACLRNSEEFRRAIRAAQGRVAGDSSGDSVRRTQQEIVGLRVRMGCKAPKAALLESESPSQSGFPTGRGDRI